MASTFIFGLLGGSSSSTPYLSSSPSHGNRTQHHLPTFPSFFSTPSSSSSSSFDDDFRNLRTNSSQTDVLDGDSCMCYEEDSISFLTHPDFVATFQWIGFDRSGTNSVLLNPGQRSVLRVAGKAIDNPPGYQECPDCISQIYVAGRGALSEFKVCLGSHNSDFDFDQSIRFAAPDEPGVYFFYTDWSWEYSCNYNMRGGSFPRAIATVYVAEPSSVVGDSSVEEMNEACDFEYDGESASFVSSSSPPPSCRTECEADLFVQNDTGLLGIILVVTSFFSLPTVLRFIKASLALRSGRMSHPIDFDMKLHLSLAFFTSVLCFSSLYYGVRFLTKFGVCELEALMILVWLLPIATIGKNG